MKKSIFQILLFVTLFLHFQNTQAQVKGNKKIITQTIEVVPFDQIHINFPVIVNIDANAEYGLTITTDDNIFPEIVLENKNNKLSILQDKWIEPSSMVRVNIGMKGLTTFEIGGYGDAKVYNLDEEKFELINTVGKVMLQGKVDQFKFTINTGELDAKNLVAKNIDANIWSHGEAIVNVTNQLDGKISEDGKIVYLKKPLQLDIQVDEEGMLLSHKEAQHQKTNKTPIQYVDVKLKNNKYSRIQTYVRGPKNKKFSYGMPFNPGQKRAEHYPVGTQIFKVNKLGLKKLLVTIEAENDGKTVNLFKTQ